MAVRLFRYQYIVASRIWLQWGHFFDHRGHLYSHNSYKTHHSSSARMGRKARFGVPFVSAKLTELNFIIVILVLCALARVYSISLKVLYPGGKEVNCWASYHSVLAFYGNVDYITVCCVFNSHILYHNDDRMCQTLPSTCLKYNR